MKNLITKAIPALLLLISFTAGPAFAQVITTGPDSTVVRTDADPLPPEQKGLSKPGKAALLSAIVPGLGQAYNKSYWKIPLIYVADASIAYAIYFNHTMFLRYRSSLQHRLLPVPYTNDRYYGIYSDNALRQGRDYHRRWRDLSMLYAVLAHGLNITEAYVHAHLKGFDVSDELTLQIQPDLLRLPNNLNTPVLSFRLNIK